MLEWIELNSIRWIGFLVIVKGVEEPLTAVFNLILRTMERTNQIERLLIGANCGDFDFDTTYCQPACFIWRKTPFPHEHICANPHKYPIVKTKLWNRNSLGSTILHDLIDFQSTYDYLHINHPWKWASLGIFSLFPFTELFPISISVACSNHAPNKLPLHWKTSTRYIEYVPPHIISSKISLYSFQIALKESKLLTIIYNIINSKRIMETWTTKYNVINSNRIIEIHVW